MQSQPTSQSTDIRQAARLSVAPMMDWTDGGKGITFHGVEGGHFDL
ncbi:hypothetical protein [Limimaricola cinnabarinus]